jgi:hypothetical protein
MRGIIAPPRAPSRIKRRAGVTVNEGRMAAEGERPGAAVATGSAPMASAAGNAAGNAAAGRRDGTRIALALAVLGVLALAVALHAVRLGAAPGWDPQEGYNLDLAWNLLHGRLRLFALSQAFAQHPPLFYLQLALFIRLFGYSIVAVRALAAVYAVLTCAALLSFGWRALGPGPALWAGVAFSVAPLFLANTRWGYSYSALMFVVVVCLWAVWRYLERPARNRLLLAAGLAGLGALCDYEGIALVLLVVLVALWLRRGRDAGLALLLGLGLPLVGLLACFAAAPGVFLADAGDTFGRAAGGGLALQLADWLVNYYRFVTFDPWIVLGLVGLFVVRARRARVLLLAATVALALVVLKVRVVGPSFHTAVPLIPLLALGAGAALDVALRRVYGWVRGGMLRLVQGDAGAMGSEALDERPDEGGVATVRSGGERASTGRPYSWRASTGRPYNSGGHRFDVVRRAASGRGPNVVAALVAFLVVVAPVALALAGDAGGLATTFATRDDAALATDPAGAQAAAAYVLAHARPGDVVLGSPQVVWQLDQPDGANGQPRALYAADILQTVAYGGQAAAFYPAGLARDRWAFDVSLGHARYVIVDDVVRRLAAPDEVAGLGPVLAAVQGWPVVYQRGEYTIYERPGG